MCEWRWRKLVFDLSLTPAGRRLVLWGLVLVLNWSTSSIICRPHKHMNIRRASRDHPHISTRTQNTQVRTCRYLTRLVLFFAQAAGKHKHHRMMPWKYITWDWELNIFTYLLNLCNRSYFLEPFVRLMLFNISLPNSDYSTQVEKPRRVRVTDRNGCFYLHSAVRNSEKLDKFVSQINFNV